MREAVRLRDLAVFIRSKNAGSFVLTFDLFFETDADCRRVLRSGVLAPERIGEIYRIDPASVKLIHYKPANAIKISIPRPIAAGEVGDCDVAGGQQFVPLLELMVPHFSESEN